MPAKIPAQLEETNLLHAFLTSTVGLARIHQGKVRNTYALPNPELLLQVATDRVSINDFVLPCTIPSKGEILTALSIFWFTKVLEKFDNHLVAFGVDGVRNHLPAEAHENVDLAKRAIVVRKLDMIPVECIVRGYLTGSGLKSYDREGHVCGIILPDGLHDGSRLNPPIFTPTTKAEEGHDEDMDCEFVSGKYPGLESRSLGIYAKAAEFALERGVIIADTKLEFGKDALGDEVFTPDSSRFWDKDEWLVAHRAKKSPSPYDKQVVRDWGKTVPLPEGMCDNKAGIGNLDPMDGEHIAFVHGLEVPEQVLAKTAQKYHDIFERLTGMTLKTFQGNHMGCPFR